MDSKRALEEVEDWIEIQKDHDIDDFIVIDNGDSVTVYIEDD